MRELRIRDVQFDNPFALAPLAGITDAPFRRICSMMGASFTWSEMISAKGLYYNDKSTETLLSILPGEGKVNFQIFGSDTEIMGLMAEKLNGRDNVLLDINMGCPVPKIVKNGEGSALLKDPDRIYQIVKAVSEKSTKPLTCKIRLGFNDESINYLDTADAIFSGGGEAVCLHGRTREQYYEGKADWSAIGKLKEKFPDKVIIGNGDVTDAESAFRMMDETGCDFVLIGRGALGNPWLFRDLKLAYERVKTGEGSIYQRYLFAFKNGEFEPNEVDLEERKSMIIRQLNDTAELKGEYSAVREMRKHIGWYIKGFKGSAKLRGVINTIDDIDELRSRISCL